VSDVRVLVTGAGGILGTALQRSRPAAVELVPLRHAQLDVTDRRATFAAVAAAKPRWVVHCAAMTAVDDCEKEPERAFRANWIGTVNVLDAAAAVGARTVVLSSDYVFDGTKGEPYVEHDCTNPLSVYGRSKHFGELEALAGRDAYVVRTQWLYGAGGRNFVDTIVKLAREKPSLKVVDDQRGCPTWSGHLAPALWRLVAEEPGAGLWHVSAGGAATWFEFAREIVRGVGLATPVEPCTTADFPRPARRPADAVLRNLRLELTIGDSMAPWPEGLRCYLSELRARS
jgi:dTDP-4-dehydrorhamnose reductase